MIEPSVWGPALWKAFHLVALGYPSEPTHDNAETYKKFYTSFGTVIPCCKCRDNYQRHFIELPIEQGLGSKDDLFAWTVAMHNVVNRETNKPLVAVDVAKSSYVLEGPLNPKHRNDETCESSDAPIQSMWITISVGVISVAIAALIVYLLVVKSKST